jgi:hypothetical protein
MLAPVLALTILAGYAASLWWLLRRESATTLVWLVGLIGLSTSLRLVYTTQYPNGMNEDEVKILWCASDMLRAGRIFYDDCTGIPALLSVLFDAQIASWIGPSRWAIRGLSFLGGTLAVPAAFAAARSLGVRVAAALAAAGFVAVLPWALLYGRVHQSGEMVFEALLVTACLARFLRAEGGWQEALIGGGALTLLLQTYYSGRSLLGLTLVAVVLAPGRYRLWCLAIAALGLLGWYPYWAAGNRYALVGISGTFVQPGMAEDPLGMLVQKTLQALQALVNPVAYDQWLTIRAAAVHPLWILALALLGSFTGVRRSLFLWAGFAGCLAPAIIGYSPLPSARRMLLGLPFICLAAACALDLVPWRRLRVPLCAGVFVVTAVWSVRFFFSADFWRPESLWVFDADRWNAVESLPLPPHPPLVVSRDFGYFGAPRARFDDDSVPLSADNVYPPSRERRIYAFGPQFALLQPVYMSIFGPARVRSFGQTFTVAVDDRDWSWLRDYGWTYRATCDGQTRSGQIPFLVFQDLTFEGMQCGGQATHAWSGRWQGPPSKLRLYTRGDATIEVDGESVAHQQAYDALLEAPVDSGSRVIVRITPPPGGPGSFRAQLVRLTPTGEHAPFLEWVKPEPVEAATP